MTEINPTCSVDGCDERRKALGMCAGHYAQHREGREITPIDRRPRLDHLEWPPQRDDGLCAVDDCPKPLHARGVCHSHWTQIRHGRPVGSVRHFNKVVDGCKVCGVCNIEKPVGDFGKKLNGVQWMCTQCRRIDSRAKQYGLTRDEVLALCEVSLCEACGCEVDSNTRNHHIDHCHDTGRVRGVLCPGCNSALGHAKDDPRVLRALAEYIERSTIAA